MSPPNHNIHESSGSVHHGQQQQQQHHMSEQQLASNLEDPQQLQPGQQQQQSNFTQLQQQQYQQFIQQQQHLGNAAGQLMPSAMPQSNYSNNNNFGQMMGNNNYPMPYQQSIMQYFQYQQLALQQQQQQQQQSHPADNLQDQAMLYQQQQQLQQQQLQQQQQLYASMIQQQQAQAIAAPQQTVAAIQPSVSRSDSQHSPIAKISSRKGSTQFTSPVVSRSSSAAAINGLDSSKKKRMRRSDHAMPGDDGDSELKEMAYKALEVPLEEFAAQVRAVENESPTTSSPVTANARQAKEEESSRERKRQVFGMVFLIRSCQLSEKAVVARNRIYARYMAECANNGLVPISAASFGKLVRLLFPSITTRRLGMRGNSKYHYCGIQLIGDNSPSNSPSGAGQGQTPIASPFATPHTINSLEGTSGNSPASMLSRTSSIANMSQSFIGTSHSSTPALDNDFKNFVTPNLKFSTNLLNDLQNSHNERASSSYLASSNFPSIESYLPEGVDKTNAATLESLYKAHCNSVFESLRYMQAKKLFSYVSSFALSLTPPIYKLYVSEELQKWVVDCDVIMYRSIMRMLSKLASQKIPAHVAQQLLFIVDNYSEKYQTALKKLPSEFTKAKLRPVERFARLTSRLLKVSNSSSSAAKILSSANERAQMLKDWQKCDFKDIIDKDVPCSNPAYIERITTICTKEVPSLLQFDPADELVQGTSDEEHNAKVQDILIKKWAEYLIKLPTSFPTIPPRMFLLCISSILTTTLREMTLLEGESFGAWWILRCWIDDWLGWCAELTGFLDIPDLDSEPNSSDKASAETNAGPEEDEQNSGQNDDSNEDASNYSNNNDASNDSQSMFIKDDEVLRFANQNHDEIDLLNI